MSEKQKKSKKLFIPTFNLFHDLPEGQHHEVALMHQGMGNLQRGGIHGDIIIEQDVDIDDAVVVVYSWLSIHHDDGFPGTSHLPLYLLGYAKQQMRCQ